MVGHRRTFTTEAPSFRFGRKATKHVRTLFDRLWLQAVGRRIAIYVGFTSSTGNSDAEFPFLIAHRTHADEPWKVAYDPKRSSAPEP